MSQTDDTDDLLLIPPDFFVIDRGLDDPDTSVPYYGLVNDLITQVNKLECRINSIQNSTERISADVSGLTESDYYYDPGRYMSEIGENTNGEYSGARHIDYPGSTQSTPQKPKSKFILSSLPNTPAGRKRYSPRKNKSSHVVNAGKRSQSNVPQTSDTGESETKSTKVLTDIDEFIANVQTLQRLSSKRSLGRKSEKEIKVIGLENYGEKLFLVHFIPSSPNQFCRGT